MVSLFGRGFDSLQLHYVPQQGIFLFLEMQDAFRPAPQTNWRISQFVSVMGLYAFTSLSCTHSIGP